MVGEEGHTFDNFDVELNRGALLASNGHESHQLLQEVEKRLTVSRKLVGRAMRGHHKHGFSDRLKTCENAQL